MVEREVPAPAPGEVLVEVAAYVCAYCRSGGENLCDAPEFTGATRDGGYTTHVVADARFCFRLPDGLDDIHAAPLLFAGLIGWRAYRMAGEAQRLGLYGFGAAAHLLAQVAVHQGRDVLAFTKPGDAAGRTFAHSSGCAWAGGSLCLCRLVGRALNRLGRRPAAATAWSSWRWLRRWACARR